MNTEPTAAAAVREAAFAPAARPTKTRWLILSVISVMYLICYMDRSSISVAAPFMAAAFKLSKTQMAIVFSTFAWAYAIGQIPGGWLGDRFGPRKVLSGIMTWWAITATMTGAAFGFVSVVSARFLLGLGEAGAFPVATRGMQLWFPRSERGVISGITHSCARLAGAITPFIAVSILVAFGWRAIFYIFGSLGVLWSVGFYLFYRNRPENHTGVNEGELARIRGRNPDGSVKQLETGPAAGCSLGEDSSLSQYVESRDCLRMLLLRKLLFPYVVPDLSARIPAYHVKVARYHRLDSSVHGHAWGDHGRITGRFLVPQNRAPSILTPRRSRAGVTSFRTVRDPSRDHAQCLERGAFLGHFQFLFGYGRGTLPGP